MTAFWSDQLADVAPSHLISTDLADVPDDLRGDDLEGRVMLCHKAEMLPIECIVRGYLTGSAWKEYKASGTMHGTSLPEGLQESAQLPEPVFTPSTKAEVGDHDENISFEAAVDLVGTEVAEAARDTSLELYRRGAEWAAERGILIADTKFELGMVEGRLTVCDEVLTPDSSRFWPADQWSAGLDAAVVRQAAGPGPPGRPRLGQDPTAPTAARRGGHRRLAALHRGLRADQRSHLRRLAGGGVTSVRARPHVVRDDERMTFEVHVEVTLRPGIADPEGATIERSLPALGFDEVRGVSVGKSIRFEVEADDEAAARARVEELCERFLTNPVIEDAGIQVVAA